MKPDLLIHLLITRSNVSDELSTITWMHKRFVQQDSSSFIIILVFSSSIPTITLFPRFELDFAPFTKQITLGKVDVTTSHDTFDVFDSFSTIKELVMVRAAGDIQ